MAEELKVGCARPTGGPVGETVEPQTSNNISTPKEETAMIKVGQKAPDFTAPAYHKGKFISVKSFLSILANGWYSVFIREISHSSERQKFRQLPKKLASLKSLGFRYFL